MRLRRCLIVVLALSIALPASTSPLPGTAPLTTEGDLSARMVAGIDAFLMRETAGSVTGRAQLWKHDFSSEDAAYAALHPNRIRFARQIGAVDHRLPVGSLEFISSTSSPARVAENDDYEVFAIRWPVFDGVHGEGLWLKQRKPPRAHVIAVPDADQSPEMIAGLEPGLKPDAQFARRLAEQGCDVLIPALLSRDDRFSGNPAIDRFTNQPHREWIYRQAFELGRHIIGFEVQKVLALVDWLALPRNESSAPIGIAGYSEGGLIAFHAAALDPRLRGALVSGYFNRREGLWHEPIYRNVFGLLREFGDAEIASMIFPRGLVVEHSEVPGITGPPAPRGRRSGAAPGVIATADYAAVESELERARSLVSAGGPAWFNAVLISGAEGISTGPGSDRALESFLKTLGLNARPFRRNAPVQRDARPPGFALERQQRAVRELTRFCQELERELARERAATFWSKLNLRSPEAFLESTREWRRVFEDEVIGRVPGAAVAPQPRSRKVLETERWTAFDVVLDVRPDVFAWGVLLLPRDLQPGEKRPAVVCQHGLEGLPMDTLTRDAHAPAFAAYRGFAAELADRGFIVFAPHNPYRGGDRFRVLQRKANPLRLSLFSFIVAQHRVITDWLAEQPFVDEARIGFYGLSYGGKTAVRVPPLVERYALSICSGDFNDWIRKNVSVDFPASYMFTGEYEMPEFGLAPAFNYGEMTALIAPRPFMVERGHADAVATDEWVASEFAKVRRLYNQLGIGDRTEIEFFNGPHAIHGTGTFEFLHRHLQWPRRSGGS